MSSLAEGENSSLFFLAPSPYLNLILSLTPHLLIPSLWVFGLQHIHFEGMETFSP